VIVRPETVIGWHRHAFRWLWAWKSRHRFGRPRVPQEVRALIRTISEANPLWGAPRIHGELLKLGIQVSQATVAKYMRRRLGPPSQSWRTFLTNGHRACVVRFGPAGAQPPACGARRGDGTSNGGMDRPTGPRSLPVACRSPIPAARPGFVVRRTGRGSRSNGDDECSDGSALALAKRLRRTVHRIRPTRVSRSCDHLHRGRLQRVLTQYVEYYERSRTHLALDKDAPTSRPVSPVSAGPIIAVPQMMKAVHLATNAAWRSHPEPQPTNTAHRADSPLTLILD
jgi:hypothetical protein